MTDSKTPTALAPAEFQILLALADGAKHGHGIKLDVRDRTEGQVVLGPGTLYGAIKRLLDRDWLAEVPPPNGERTGDERRRYYEATPEGLAAARSEAHRMSTLLGIATAKRLVG